jgi:hypothetical protein
MFVDNCPLHLELIAVAFGLVICPLFEDENLSEKFSAEMEFYIIDPRLQIARKS